MAYEGPGIYKHYKGGHYHVWGIAMHESEDYPLVIYSSLSVEHELQRDEDGVDWVARPLAGRPDSFNDVVAPSPGIQTARFRKIN